MDDSKVNDRLLSPEASMILALWDGTHGDHRRGFGDEYDQMDGHYEELFFADYVTKWFSVNPSVHGRRAVIPLFQLAAELVASRLLAPGTYNAAVASWEVVETEWDFARERSDVETDDYSPDFEWVETLAGWEEIPTMSWRQVTPGGMAAYRVLFGLGDGSFALPFEVLVGEYRPFHWSHGSGPQVDFRFSGDRRERVSDALIGGHDYGVRSAWIRHLIRAVDYDHSRVGHEESAPALLFRAHVELLEQLERSARWLSGMHWPLVRPEYTLDPGTNPF